MFKTTTTFVLRNNRGWPKGNTKPPQARDRGAIFLPLAWALVALLHNLWSARPESICKNYVFRKYKFCIEAVLCMLALCACSTKEPEAISSDKRLRDTQKAAATLMLSLMESDAHLRIRTQCLADKNWPVSLQDFLTFTGSRPELDQEISSQCEIPNTLFYVTATIVPIAGQSEPGYLLNVFQTQDGARLSRKFSLEPFLVIPTAMSTIHPTPLRSKNPSQD